jgi:ubiquinone/menaquinone biosynthesis C-methylase UbiE
MDDTMKTDRVAEQIAMHEKLAQVYRDKRYAPAYSRIYQAYWNERLCEISLCKKGARVMDLGCGTGVLFPQMLARRFDVTGVDVSPAMLTVAQEEFPSVHCTCADAANLSFADASFDAVFCRGSLHHVADLLRTLKELSRVLRKDAVLVFSEPSNDSVTNRIARHLMYRRSSEFSELDEGFRRKRITPLLEAAGFSIEYSRGFGFAAYALCGFPDKLAILSHIPFACGLAKILISVDNFLERLPAVHTLGLHWQVRARKL